MYEKIVVALDGSHLAEEALPHVIALAEKFNSSVTLLRVISYRDAYTAALAAGPMGTGSMVGAPMGQAIAAAAMSSPGEALKAENKEAEDYLLAIASNLAAHGLQVTHEKVEGAPADTIVSRTRAHGADLLVMTTRGQGGFKRLLMGSVADAVVREAPCPILLIKAGMTPEAEGRLAP